MLSLFSLFLFFNHRDQFKTIYFVAASHVAELLFKGLLLKDELRQILFKLVNLDFKDAATILVALNFFIFLTKHVLDLLLSVSHDCLQFAPRSFMLLDLLFPFNHFCFVYAQLFNFLP